MPACVIGGVGLITPLAAGARATWDALLAGRSITDHARAALPIPTSIPRVIALAHAAADEAIADAHWSAAARSDPQTALVVGTSKGPVESWLGEWPGPPSAPTSDNPSPAGGLQPTGIGQLAASLAARFNIIGGSLTLSAACASGLHALIRAALLIHSGQARRVLVVAAEASVHPLFLGSFHRLGVLPRPGIGCRPFDQSREGFLMSEAAAAVCLEAVDSPLMAQVTAAISDASLPKAIAAPIRIAIDRFALGADAFHLTGSDPSGRVLRQLLQKVTQDVPFDLIHTHGTGTPLNDAIELAALNATFTGPASLPTLYSHKGALGHSLGAAGLVAIVLNCLAHHSGMIPPNIQTHSPLPTVLPIPTTPQPHPIRRSLALAAGFGGPTALVSLKTL